MDAAAFTYDARGNLTSDGVNTYGYDVFNRLRSATTGAGASTYLSDPLGRLARETAPSATRRFLYDGDRLVGEYTNGGTFYRRYVPGPGVDEVAGYYLSDATTLYRPITDERGSVIAYTTPGAAVVGGKNTYDDYGRPGGALYGRFQYTGQTVLTDTPLYHYKARAYHPGIGRFLQTDPIGYVDSLNLYAYVLNDPINGTDPTGMIAVDPTTWVDEIVVVGRRSVPWAFKSFMWASARANLPLAVINTWADGSGLARDDTCTAQPSICGWAGMAVLPNSEPGPTPDRTPDQFTRLPRNGPPRWRKNDDNSIWVRDTARHGSHRHSEGGSAWKRYPSEAAANADRHRISVWPNGSLRGR